MESSPFCQIPTPDWYQQPWLPTPPPMFPKFPPWNLTMGGPPGSPEIPDLETITFGFQPLNLGSVRNRKQPALPAYTCISTMEQPPKARIVRRPIPITYLMIQSMCNQRLPYDQGRDKPFIFEISHA